MELTRAEAISKHRIMWNELADEIEKYKKVIFIIQWKKEYMLNKNYHCESSCFLCEYASSIDNCETCCACPLDIGDEECLGGLYEKCCNAKTWQEQAALARKIANLPERKV